MADRIDHKVYIEQRLADGSAQITHPSGVVVILSPQVLEEQEFRRRLLRGANSPAAQEAAQRRTAREALAPVEARTGARVVDHKPAERPADWQQPPERAAQPGGRP